MSVVTWALTETNFPLAETFLQGRGTLKLTLSGKMIEVLLGREEDLEDGREIAALTAAAMVVILRKGSEREKEREDKGDRCYL